MVFEYKIDLIAIFDQNMGDEENWDSDAVINAEVLKRYLKEFDFNFKLHLFSIVFRSADV